MVEKFDQIPEKYVLPKQSQYGQRHCITGHSYQGLGTIPNAVPWMF